MINGYEKISKGLSPSNDPKISKFIIRDLSNYEIQSGLSNEEFLKKLKNQFFTHPFIKKIIEILDENNGEIFYGSLRRILETRLITDVPKPDRQDVDICLTLCDVWYFGKDIEFYHDESPVFSAHNNKHSKQLQIQKQRKTQRKLVRFWMKWKSWRPTKPVAVKSMP